MRLELPDRAVQVAHNTAARTVYIIHPDSLITIWQPDLNRSQQIELEHDVTRFAHSGTITALHGLHGGTILSGTEVLFTSSQPGPYRFVDGKFRHQGPLDLPDIRGIDPSEVNFATHLGTVEAAARYRGAVCTFYSGTSIFSNIGLNDSPAPDCSRDILGEVYVHPHIKLMSVAVPTGWIYTTDDTRTWNYLPKEGWPIRLSDKDIPVIKGVIVE